MDGDESDDADDNSSSTATTNEELTSTNTSVVVEDATTLEPGVEMVKLSLLESDDEDDARLTWEQLPPVPATSPVVEAAATPPPPSRTPSPASAQSGRTLAVSNVTMSVPHGALVAVVGHVGAGKSSLLNGLLGEVPMATGSCGISGSVGYVPQTVREYHTHTHTVSTSLLTLAHDCVQAWVRSATVRDNITCGQEMQEARYQRVVKACALEADFAELRGGDAAEVGERGITLSGGQKARLALARACYAGADVYLLDDPLSAVS